MKIIDLLNKIANGEEVPQEIIAGDSEHKYYYNKELKDYRDEKTHENLFEDEIGKFLKYYLNDEVEILEEEPRDIEICGSFFTKSEYDKLAQKREEKEIPEKINNWVSNVGRVDNSNIEEYVHNLFEQQTILYFKINSIIDYLKSKGE